MQLDDLLDQLKARQTCSGRAFAARLGISESYWSLLRRGKRRLTPSVAHRAIAVFPDLAIDYLASLRRGGSDAA